MGLSPEQIPLTFGTDPHKRTGSQFLFVISFTLQERALHCEISQGITYGSCGILFLFFLTRHHTCGKWTLSARCSLCLQFGVGYSLCTVGLSDRVGCNSCILLQETGLMREMRLNRTV